MESLNECLFVFWARRVPAAQGMLISDPRSSSEAFDTQLVQLAMCSADDHFQI